MVYRSSKGADLALAELYAFHQMYDAHRSNDRALIREKTDAWARAQAALRER